MHVGDSGRWMQARVVGWLILRMRNCYESVVVRRRDPVVWVEESGRNSDCRLGWDLVIDIYYVYTLCFGSLSHVVLPQLGRTSKVLHMNGDMQYFSSIVYHHSSQSFVITSVILTILRLAFITSFYIFLCFCSATGSI